MLADAVSRLVHTIQVDFGSVSKMATKEEAQRSNKAEEKEGVRVAKANTTQGNSFTAKVQVLTRKGAKVTGATLEEGLISDRKIKKAKEDSDASRIKMV